MARGSLEPIFHIPRKRNIEEVTMVRIVAFFTGPKTWSKVIIFLVLYM